MADKKIKLTKKVISHKKSNKLHVKSFKDLTKSSRILDDDKIEDIYNNLFYEIPKKGKNSHETIIVQSKDYLYPGINKKLDDKIDNLINKIEARQKQLSDLKKPPEEHPDYPNGSMLTAGTFDGGQYQGMQTVYYMQQGRKRPFASETLYKIVRKAEKYQGDPYSELVFLSVNELNSIPDGKKISSNASLSFENIKADYGEIYQRLPYETLDLYCEGREAEDTLDLVSGDFWLDTDEDDACTVKYIKNTFDGDEHLGEDYQFSIETKTIGVGETRTITFAKDDDVQNLKGIPAEFTEDDYDIEYDYDTDIQQTGVRHWGKDRRFKGIVYAEGRLFITQGGDAFNTRQHGNITEGLTFDKVTSRGTRLIYTVCRQPDGSYDPPGTCYGQLNQRTSWLIEEFKDSTFPYYKKYLEIFAFHLKNHLGLSSAAASRTGLIGKTFGLYGQPILQNGENYYVYLTSTKIDAFDEMTNYNGGMNDYTIGNNGHYHYFYNLKTEKLARWHDKDIEDVFFNVNLREFQIHKAFFAIDTSSGPEGALFPFGKQNNIGLSNNKFNWQFIHPNKIAYIGLVGYNTNNAPNNSGNVFNPTDEGSNFEITPGAQDILTFNGRSDTNTSDPDPCLFTKAQLMVYSLSSGGELPEGCNYNNCLDC